MKELNASPDRLISIGYEGEDNVTVIKFQYDETWLDCGDGEFKIRVLRHGDTHAYNATEVTDDRESMTLTMTVTDIELSVRGRGELQLVYICSGAVKKSEIFRFNVSRAIDSEVVDPPEGSIIAEVEKSLAEIKDEIGSLADLTTEDKTSLVSAINEVNAKEVTVDSELSAESENPVQNKAIMGAFSEAVRRLLVDEMHISDNTDDITTLQSEFVKNSKTRVFSLTETQLASGSVIEAVGVPTYIADVTQYPRYGLTETGWYIFARILSKDGGAIASGVTVEGADGSIIAAGEDHVDIAVRFDVASMSRQVTVNWGTETETFTFKATDLAIRNLDYRTTFYVYPLDEFIAWTYTETTDTSFVSGKHYYTKDENDVYTEAEVTVGGTIPAGTYYVHAKARFEGFTRNVTYRYTGVIDCPIEIVLPDIPEDGYGAWVEFQLRYNDTYSATLIPPSSDIKAAEDATPKQTSGINVLDLHYLSVNDLKIWRMINTHSGYNGA